MNPILIAVIILLVVAVAACVLMVFSIKGYHEQFRNMSRRNRQLVQRCTEIEQELNQERQRKSPITGRSDSAELQELRRQIATLSRKAEEAERVLSERNQYKERCRRLEAQLEAQQEDDDTQIGTSVAEDLQIELSRVKTAYGKLLEEHEQLQQTIGNEKAVVLEKESLSAELSRVKEENAQLLREKNQFEEALGQSTDEQTEKLSAELSRVKYAYAQQLQEHERLKAAFDQAKAEIAALRGKLQEREAAFQTAAAQPAAPAAPAENTAEVQDKYLEMALDPRKLDNAGKIRFLNVLVMLDGTVKLTGSNNIRLSELAMLEDGKVIPNPYFYRRFGADGELGADIHKMQHVMQFAEPDSLRRYRLEALRPAVAEENGDSYRLVQPGELMLG